MSNTRLSDPGTSGNKEECSAQSLPSSQFPRTLYVHPERKQIFSCSTTPFYGQATIKWFGALTINDAEWYDLTNLTSIAELKRGGINGASYIKTVSLRLPPANSMRLGALQCRGYSSADVDFTTHTSIVDQVVLKPYGLFILRFVKVLLSPQYLYPDFDINFDLLVKWENSQKLLGLPE